MGKEGSFGIPPRVEFKDPESFGAEDYLITYLAPYFVALAAMVLFSGTANNFIRLIPYTAFFDIQANLTGKLLENALFGLQGGDGLSLVARVSLIAPGYAFPTFFLILCIIGFSFLIFFRYYKKDYNDSLDRQFFRDALSIFILYGLIDLFYTIFIALPQMPK